MMQRCLLLICANRECSKLMVTFHQKAGTGKLNAVHRKYSSWKFGYAAKVEPAPFVIDRRQSWKEVDNSKLLSLNFLCSNRSCPEKVKAYNPLGLGRFLLLSNLKVYFYSFVLDWFPLNASDQCLGSVSLRYYSLQSSVRLINRIR